MLNNRYDFRIGKYWMSELGVRINGMPNYEIAQKDITFVDIPGKDGREIIDNKRYLNVDFSRKLALLTKYGVNAEDKVQSLIRHLCYSQGYQEFQDSDHPGLKTEAVITNLSKVVRDLRRFQTAEIKLSRKPFWYFPTSFEEVSIDLNGTTKLMNLSSGPTKPYLVFDFDGTAGHYEDFRLDLTIVSKINGVSTTYTINYSHYLVIRDEDVLHIDFEEGTVSIRSSTGTVKKYYDIDLPEELGNELSITLGTHSAITSATITPKWRCL